MFRSDSFPYLPKDFIETAEGLIFAVVSYQPQDGKVGCFLRYVNTDGQGWRKVNTQQANQLLEEHYPRYLYQSEQFDAKFHAVAVSNIVIHHRPEQRLQYIMSHPAQGDIEQKCQRLLEIFQQCGVTTDYLGLTGSMLIGQQKAGSDIDFAVYGRQNFQVVRSAIEQCIQNGLLEQLDLSLMEDNFARRDSDLSFDEFAWHEQRKFNKAAIDGTKFDIGMVCLADELIAEEQAHYEKISTKAFSTRVTNADYAFDFPAIYYIEHPDIKEIHCYTPTYCGQAFSGEMISVSGAVERNTESGECRLIVGSTREAHGEYIKVLTTEA